MAILTAPNHVDEANVKRVQITQLGDRAVNVLDNLINELEQFSAWTFTEFGNPTGLVDSADLAILTAKFEARRAKVQLLMDRMNAISAIAGANVLPADIPANAATFMTAIRYNHAVYSATFIK